MSKSRTKSTEARQLQAQIDQITQELSGFGMGAAKSAALRNRRSELQEKLDQLSAGPYPSQVQAAAA